VGRRARHLPAAHRRGRFWAPSWWPARVREPRRANASPLPRGRTSRPSHGLYRWNNGTAVPQIDHLGRPGKCLAPPRLAHIEDMPMPRAARPPPRPPASQPPPGGRRSGSNTIMTTSRITRQRQTHPEIVAKRYPPGPITRTLTGWPSGVRKANEVASATPSPAPGGRRQSGGPLRWPAGHHGGDGGPVHRLG